MTQNPARDPFSSDFRDELAARIIDWGDQTYEWLLAEARWFAEQARAAESVIQLADGVTWPHDEFPWERP